MLSRLQGSTTRGGPPITLSMPLRGKQNNPKSSFLQLLLLCSWEKHDTETWRNVFPLSPDTEHKTWVESHPSHASAGNNDETGNHYQVVLFATYALDEEQQKLAAAALNRAGGFFSLWWAWHHCRLSKEGVRLPIHTLQKVPHRVRMSHSQTSAHSTPDF